MPTCICMHTVHTHTCTHMYTHRHAHLDTHTQQACSWASLRQALSWDAASFLTRGCGRWRNLFRVVFCSASFFSMCAAHLTRASDVHGRPCTQEGLGVRSHVRRPACSCLFRRPAASGRSCRAGPGGRCITSRNGHCISSQLWTQRPHVQTGMPAKTWMVLLQLGQAITAGALKTEKHLCKYF